MQLESILNDITDLEIDAIFYSCNTRMNFGDNQHSVAEVINNKTDGRLEKKIHKGYSHYFPLPLEKVVITDGDNLPCQKMLHLATHGNYKEESIPAANKMDHRDPLAYGLEKVIINTVKEGIKNILLACDDQSLSSLDIPLIGSCTLKLNPILVVEIILAETVFHLARNPNSKIQNFTTQL